MQLIVWRHAWCFKWHRKSNQGTKQRKTEHTREDPKQDVNSNYC